jgi:hypothetical protein
VVTARVDPGQRIDFFNIQGGDTWVLTAAGAQALNSGLGFNGLFSAGFVFGKFVTTLTA